MVYKAYESHLPKEKWTWLHFLPSSVPFLTPTTFVAGSRSPWGICRFTNTCISGCAPQCGYHFGIWHQAQGPKAGIEKGFQRQWTVWPAGSAFVASGSWRVSQGSDGRGAEYSCCSALCKRSPECICLRFSSVVSHNWACSSKPARAYSWNPGSWAEQCNWENNRASVAQKDYCWTDINRLFGLWAQIHFVICWPLLTRLPKPVTPCRCGLQVPRGAWMWLIAVTMAVGSVLLCSWTWPEFASYSLLVFLLHPLKKRLFFFLKTYPRDTQDSM